MTTPLADWKADRFIGAIGIVSALGALVMGPYLWVRKVRIVAADPGEFIWDFSYFYRAAVRFATDPLTLYADPDYFYPPPSVFAFLPWLSLPETIAYQAAIVLNVGIMAVCGFLAVRLWERRAGPSSSGARWAAVLFVLASAPVFQLLKYAQVGALVLLSGLVALDWLDRRPGAAGVALAGGFWLKLYPLALAPLGVMRAGRTRFGVGLAFGLALVPIALLPWLPVSFYIDYASDRLATIGSTTMTAALNQSLPAALERALRPAEAALNIFTSAEVRPEVRLVTGLFGALAMGATVWSAWRGTVSRVTAGFILLALLPLLSNYGWEHSYVLALPLVQATVLVASVDPRRTPRIVAGLAVACFLCPTLPRAILEHAVALDLRPAQDLFFMRFPLVLALATYALVRWEQGGAAPSGASGLGGREGA